MLDLIRRLVREEEGQGMVEYGLILAFISIAVILALTAMSGSLETIFDKIKTALASGAAKGGS